MSDPASQEFDDAPSCWKCVFMDNQCRCRANAPSPIVTDNPALADRLRIVWPKVSTYDWCADFEPRDEYVG